MKKAIEMELIDIRIEMEKLESNNTMAFTTERWKILQAQREVLAKILASAKN